MGFEHFNGYYCVLIDSKLEQYIDYKDKSIEDSQTVMHFVQYIDYNLDVPVLTKIMNNNTETRYELVDAFFP